MQAVLNNEGIFVWYLEEKNAPAILLITKKEKINKNIGREEGEEITYEWIDKFKISSIILIDSVLYIVIDYLDQRNKNPTKLFSISFR